MARGRKFTIDDLYHITKETLVNEGYNGFTFRILAEKLEVSRGAIYKYFDNKDELISAYMVFEMNRFLTELKNIQQYTYFHEQFDYLLHLIFKDSKIQQIIGMGAHIQSLENKKVKQNLDKLNKLHLDMYAYLDDFVQLGKEEGKVKEEVRNSVILGFIFQTIAIPNHFNVPKEEWFHSIKEMIQYGVFR